jgi:outer membrane protein
MLTGLVLGASLALALPGAAPARAEEPPLSLGELLELTRGHNPQVRQASANLEAARARLEQTESGFWPQLSGQASWERTRNEITSSGQIEGEQRQAGLSLSQSLLNLPLWGQSRASRLEARAYAEAVRAAINEAEAAVRAAYLDLLAQTALALVYEEQERDTAAFLERARKLLAHGLAAPLEVARAGLDLAEAKRKVIEGRSTVRKRMARLAEAVGLPQVNGLPVAPWEAPAEPALARVGEAGEAGLIAQGLKNRADLARLTLLAETAQASVEAAEAGHWPTLDLQGSLGQYGEHDFASQFSSYGLFLNLPLFTGFKLRATTAERQALLKAALEARSLTALTVRRETQEALLGLWEAQAKVAVSASQLESAQENYRLIKGRHENGLATPLELSEARTQRFNALAEVQRARYGVFSALSELDRALGGGVFPVRETRP